MAGTEQENNAAILTYPDDTLEIVAGAVSVDTQNFHEEMIDFYDERDNLLKQIEMGQGIEWEFIQESL